MSRSSRLRRVALPLLVILWLSACSLRPMQSSGEATRAAVTDGSFNDAFIPGQTGNWLFEQDEQATTAIANEQLVITIAVPNTIQYATLGDRTFGDFVLEVDTWQRSGPPEGSYGVLFRIQEDGQFLRFDITGSGAYIVERHNADGSWTRLVPDWVPTTAINQGLNVGNRLKIIAAGSNLTFYANDILLIQLTDDSPVSGAIALDAGTFGGGNLQVSFDNLTITQGP